MWQRAGSAGSPWQAHPRRAVSEKIILMCPTPQITKHLLQCTEFSDFIAEHDQYFLKNLSIEKVHIKLYILK